MIRLLIIMIILTSNANAVTIEDIIAVNTEVNKVTYVTDKNNYGVENYIATPEEFYKNGGDCEDYVAAKYYKLLALGIPANNMKVAVVTRVYTVTHALLSVYFEGETYFLNSESFLGKDKNKLLTSDELYSIDPFPSYVTVENAYMIWSSKRKIIKKD